MENPLQELIKEKLCYDELEIIRLASFFQKLEDINEIDSDGHMSILNEMGIVFINSRKDNKENELIMRSIEYFNKIVRVLHDFRTEIETSNFNFSTLESKVTGS